MRAVAKVSRARANKHSANFCEQFEQRPNFASTFKFNGAIRYPSFCISSLSPFFFTLPYPTLPYLTKPHPFLLCSAMPCPLALPCLVQYGTVRYGTVRYGTVLYGTVLYCTVLYCTVLYCTVLYCTVLYCTVLYCTVLYCTVLYPIHTEIFAPKINEINFIPGRTVFLTSEKYRPTNHRPRTALCH